MGKSHSTPGSRGGSRNVRDTAPRYEKEQALVLDSLSEHVVFHDLDFRMAYVNRAAAESVGATAEELVGRHC